MISRAVEDLADIAEFDPAAEAPCSMLSTALSKETQTDLSKHCSMRAISPEPIWQKPYGLSLPIFWTTEMSRERCLRLIGTKVVANSQGSSAGTSGSGRSANYTLVHTSKAASIAAMSTLRGCSPPSLIQSASLIHEIYFIK
ncbi:hypothetical protein J2W42_005575 [Rhizobium tibeticum]|nr:hypothetical protein [Rhizobium tibeticum]